MATEQEAKEALVILSKRTCEYCINDLSLEIDDTSPIPQNLDSFSLASYTALINLKNDMDGTIGLSASTSLAKFMVGQFMFGEVSDEEVEEMAGETVAEILNVVVGNIIKDLPKVKAGGKVDISTPLVMNKTLKISKPQDGIMIISQFNTNHGALVLSYLV
jgi:CheY-specific phosphatase CheX